MKPIIGVIPLWDDEKESVWMVPGYLKGIEEAGGISMILPYTMDRDVLLQALKHIDGLLMTGGHDVDPDMYNSERTEQCGISCHTRDVMERILFHKALEKDMPVLGICRGIQMMNVLLEGTLYQDLPTEYESSIDHHMSSPYDRVQHNVNINQDTLLYSIIGKEKIGVNSYHHQAVKDTKMTVNACAEDGLIEALSLPNYRFILGVQWHPEFSYKTDDSSRKIFNAFVKACGGNE